MDTKAWHIRKIIRDSIVIVHVFHGDALDIAGDVVQAAEIKHLLRTDRGVQT
jgi:hypothetical protein